VGYNTLPRHLARQRRRAEEMKMRMIVVKGQARMAAAIGRFQKHQPVRLHRMLHGGDRRRWVVEMFKAMRSQNDVVACRRDGARSQQVFERLCKNMVQTLGGKIAGGGKLDAVIGCESFPAPQRLSEVAGGATNFERAGAVAEPRRDKIGLGRKALGGEAGAAHGETGVVEGLDVDALRMMAAPA
jgi:hypothetical protein